MAVIITRLSEYLRGRRPRSRASVLVPFLIIAVAFAALGWRSWELSERMERGLEALAVQYLEYSAEITARRVDAATQGRVYRAAEEWQQIERLSGGAPGYDSLAEWLRQNDWILSATYEPDSDLTSTLYLGQLSDARAVRDLVRSDFYTVSGRVQYSWSPSLLISQLDRAVFRQPVARSAHEWETSDLRQLVEIHVVDAKLGRGLVRREGELSVIEPLAEPLESFAIESMLRTDLGQGGSRSHRLVSLAFAITAIALLSIGAWLAIRGIRKENEATQLRAALVANVSHELRTPLAVIRIGAETLRRGERLTPEQREALQESIIREVLHLSNLVENVLDVARLQKGAKRMAPSPVDPVDLVESVIDSYGPWIESKGFSVELDLEDDVAEQMWDRDSVSRALVNLVDNAIKYSGESRSVRVALRDRKGGVEIAVSDRGIGVHQAEVERIFDPYYRAKFSDTETQRGAGLGLTLVQQIVQAHGGRVEVDSAPGEGSTFRLFFPNRPVAEASRRPEAKG
ncbi:MAG: HAMP domain-containing histidine kinase [Acidobacteria bacterium]|nr:HAMP domain-containing histidine kinase [Acidobacteriota bacterium]